MAFGRWEDDEFVWENFVWELDYLGEKRSPRLLRSFRDKWVWLSAISGTFGLVLCNGSLAFLSPVVFGTLIKTQCAFDIVFTAILNGVFVDRAVRQLSNSFVPYLTAITVVIIVGGGVLSVVLSPSQHHTATTNTSTTLGDHVPIGGVLLLTSGLICRGLNWATRSHLLAGGSAAAYSPSVQVASMNILSFLMLVGICFLVYNVYAGGGNPLWAGSGPGWPTPQEFLLSPILIPLPLITVRGFIKMHIPDSRIYVCSMRVSSVGLLGG